MKQQLSSSNADNAEASPEMNRAPTFKDVLLAKRVVDAYLPRTPLHHYPTLDALLGAEVYVKHENYQPIGAFKIRGGVNYMSKLSPAERGQGVVTASTGNHGQSIAYAARLFDVPAVIVVPKGANPVKVEAMRSHGAEVVFHGANFDESKRHCEHLARSQGMHYISSGDEPLLIAGVGTHTLEIIEDVPDIEVIIVPIGGGSGAAGASLVAKSIDRSIQVIGVQSSASPAAYLTWKQRSWQAAENRSVAGGLATGEPFMMPQQMLWQYLDDFVLVEDSDLLTAVRLYLEKAKTLAEPAGAAPLAAALNMRAALAGKKIALILSGGNISPAQLRQCLD
jgi:threonine dehydratase